MLKNLLGGLKIRTRIGIALALPLAGVLALCAIAISDQMKVAGDMARLQTLSALAPEVSALVHELQKERGNSAGFIGKKGQGAFR